VPVIRGINLPADQRFSFDDLVFVTEQKVSRDLFGNLAHPGDIVVTQRGTLGQVGLIPRPSPYPRLVVSQSQMKLTVDSAKADAGYVYYALKSPIGQHEIQSRAITAGVPHINLALFQQIRIPMPPIKVQRKVTAILSTYDDLIENNTRRIKTLEEMARRIYHEWFVAFRFPGHSSAAPAGFTAGQLPDGWQGRPLRAVTTTITRGVSPRYSDEPNRLVINQRCIRNGRLTLELARRHETVVPTDKLLRVGDVLINSTGEGTLGRVAQVLRDLKEVTVDSHVTIVRPAATTIDSHFLGLTLLCHEPELASMGIGSTGQTELGRNAIGNLLVAVPPLNLQEMFANRVGPLRHLALRLGAANEVLRATREFLLPRLISGTVDVADRDVTMPSTAA
jgi:type I restriction enzyme S subunit